MVKRKRTTLDRLLYAAQGTQKAYISDRTIFIDESVVCRVRREAAQMMGQITLRRKGKAYRECLEKLGLWQDLDRV